MHDSIIKILKERIKVERYNGTVYGLDGAARQIIDEIILPIRVDLVEAQAKNRVYEAALENSNFKAIVIRAKNNGKDNGANQD
jgi:hypothetical protein